MRKRNPYQAIREAYVAGWDVIDRGSLGEASWFTVTHESDPGEGRPDRPYIFDHVYLDSRAAWRAVVRYISKSAA